MSERQPGPYDSVARRWHALAERRGAHIIELRDSGRWKHYYTSEQLLDALRDAANTRDAWAKIAGLPEGEAEQANNHVDAELIRKAG
jgi:uncharacterized repeat protein (TIGR03809 family)